MARLGDANRRTLMLADPRLTQLVNREPEKATTLTEYAQATGLDTNRVVELLKDALDSGSLKFEPAGGEIFIHTAPGGRPVPPHMPNVPANLWENLRTHSSPAQAYLLWRLVRGLEAGGWATEAAQERIKAHLGPLQPSPTLAILVDGIVAPLILHPTTEVLANPRGPAAALSDAGATVIGIIVDSGELDPTTTAIRQLCVNRTDIKTVFLILEAPRYNPVAIRADDAAVTPRANATNQLPLD